MNIVYKWFWVYSMQDKTPHFATVNTSCKDRFNKEAIEKVFCWILNEINQKGYLSPNVVFIDGIHIKENANIRKSVKKQFLLSQRYIKNSFLNK